MNQQKKSVRKWKMFLLIALLVGLLAAFTGLAFGQGDPLTASDFAESAEQGMGDRANSWAWSMQWWNGYVYAGTNSNWHCVEVLSQSRNSFGIITYPPDDPDIDCPANELEIDMRAEIWRWDSVTGLWEQVYIAPTQVFTQYQRIGGTIIDPITETVTIPPTDIALDIGYRGMALFEEPDGTVALYVTAVSPRFAGYDAPPRILRSTDGVTFTPLPQDPGTVLGEIQETSIRNPVTHIGTDGTPRFYVQAGSSKGSGILLESEDPAGGNDNFREIPIPGALGDYKISAMTSYFGSLIVGTRDTDTGFSILRVHPHGGALPYDYEVLVDSGGYAEFATDPILNVEILDFEEYDCNLYAGGNGITIGTIPGLNDPAELFRVHPEGTWDMIVGRERIGTPLGDISPLSGFDAGFGSPYNGHMWRMGAHNGHFYVATFDGSTTLKDQDPLPPDAEKMGFDLWHTGDGTSMDPISEDGFSDQIIDPDPPRPDLPLGGMDAGGRTISSNEFGFFMGTANYWYGMRVWRAPVPGYNISVTVDGPDTVLVNTPADYTAYVDIGSMAATMGITDPITYTWEATDFPPIQHVGGLSDTITYSWATLGTKIITVRVDTPDTQECGMFQVEVVDGSTPTPTSTPVVNTPTPTSTPVTPGPTATPTVQPTATPTTPPTGVELTGFDGTGGDVSVGLTPWLALLLLLLPGGALLLSRKRR